MARRIPKPFTVEIRKSSRKPVATAAVLTPDPTVMSRLNDQPCVSWPGLDKPSGSDMVTEAEQVAPAPASGRVLPALDEPVTAPERSEPPIRHRAKRKPTAAIHEGILKAASPADLLAAAAGREGGGPVTLADTEPPEGVVDDSDARTMTATLILRQGRKRLTRGDFKRGERWKARLPAVAHQRRSRSA